MGHVCIKNNEIESKSNIPIADLDPKFINFITQNEGLSFVGLTSEQDAVDIRALSWDGLKISINSTKETEIRLAKREEDAVKKSFTVAQFIQAYLLERGGDASRMNALAAKVTSELTR